MKRAASGAAPGAAQALHRTVIMMDDLALLQPRQTSLNFVVQQAQICGEPTGSTPLANLIWIPRAAPLSLNYNHSFWRNARDAYVVYLSGREQEQAFNMAAAWRLLSGGNTWSTPFCRPKLRSFLGKENWCPARARMRLALAELRTQLNVSTLVLKQAFLTLQAKGGLTQPNLTGQRLWSY